MILKSNSPRRLHRSARFGILPRGAILVTPPPPHAKHWPGWGNPYQVGIHGTAEECLRLFVERYEHDAAYRARCRQELHGRDLACTCAPGYPCHGDALLVWANED